MENLNSVISKNLIKFRTLSNLTQVELAKKLQYSDKSISKWERGESIPDVSVLVKLSEIYGITLNDFVVDDEQIKTMPKKIVKNSHILISFLSSAFVCLVACIAFFVLSLIPACKSFAWLSFIYAIPVIAIVLTVFSCIWGPVYLRAICISIILWGVIFSACLTINIGKVWLVCIIGGAGELLIVLWANLKKLKIEQKNIMQRLKGLFKSKNNDKTEAN